MRNDADGTKGRPARTVGPRWISAHLVTLALLKREPLFGRVVEGRMELAEPGRAVAEEWRRIPALARSARLDEFTVMPNHIHGIVWLGGAGKGQPGAGRRARRRGSSEAAALGAIVAQFKAAATRRVNALRGGAVGPLWQPGYRDVAIEGEQELEAIRRYVRENPERWAEDVENPERQALTSRSGG